MAARRLNEPIEPMTLGNMRANGVRSLDVSCRLCHQTVLSAEPWPDHVPVPGIRAAHGLHQVRDHRHRRAAELA